jgi:hypothetical protein
MPHEIFLLYESKDTSSKIVDLPVASVGIIYTPETMNVIGFTKLLTTNNKYFWRETCMEEE